MEAKLELIYFPVTQKFNDVKLTGMSYNTCAILTAMNTKKIPCSIDDTDNLSIETNIRAVISMKGLGHMQGLARPSFPGLNITIGSKLGDRLIARSSAQINRCQTSSARSPAFTTFQQRLNGVDW
jgi:hypothetical protein